MSEEEWSRLLDLSLAAQAKDDVFAFGEYVFGHSPAPHHREMVDFIRGCRSDGVHGLVLEPRGFAKSTWGNTITGSHWIGNEPDLRLGLFSKSADHADAFSRGIRWTLEKNERYREVFGDLVSEAKWTDGEWLRAGSRWHGSQYATLYAQGVGGQIVSKRFDVILCDDILDKENTATRGQMAKVEDWFWQTLFPCLAPDGVCIVIGTRWAEGDLYQTLEEKGWRVLKRSALIPGKRGKLQSLWPEVWPIYKLESLRENMGTARFACAMLNDISGMMEGDVFRNEWFRYVDRLPDTPLTFRMGVDLASSTKERADYTARVISAQDGMGNFYVVEADRAKMQSGHARWVARAHDGFGYPISEVVIENQQFQSTLVQQMLEEYPHIPVIGQRADSDKGSRASAVATKYEMGKVFHLPNLPEEFEYELLSFDRGHDDFVDALGYSMSLGGQSGLIFGSVRR